MVTLLAKLFIPNYKDTKIQQSVQLMAPCQASLESCLIYFYQL